MKVLCPKSDNSSAPTSGPWNLLELTAPSDVPKPVKFIPDPMDMSNRIDEFVDLSLIPELVRRQERRRGSSERDFGLPEDLRLQEARQYINSNTESLAGRELTWNDYDLTVTSVTTFSI